MLPPPPPYPSQTTGQLEGQHNSLQEENARLHAQVAELQVRPLSSDP